MLPGSGNHIVDNYERMENSKEKYEDPLAEDRFMDEYYEEKYGKKEEENEKNDISANFSI